MPFALSLPYMSIGPDLAHNLNSARRGPWQLKLRARAAQWIPLGHEMNAAVHLASAASCCISPRLFKHGDGVLHKAFSAVGRTSYSLSWSFIENLSDLSEAHFSVYLLQCQLVETRQGFHQKCHKWSEHSLHNITMIGMTSQEIDLFSYKAKLIVCRVLKSRLDLFSKTCCVKHKNSYVAFSA